MTRISSLFRGREARNRRFDALVRPHLRKMYRMAYRWTQNREDAEDLVQETLSKLVRHLEEMERVDKLAPWLIKVLYRDFVDAYRKSRRSPLDGEDTWRGDLSLLDTLISDHRGDDDAFKRLILQRDLVKALETLPAEQRDVVILHDVEGYTAEEVGEILEISPGTVKSRLHRSRARLKKILTRMEPFEVLERVN